MALVTKILLLYFFTGTANASPLHEVKILHDTLANSSLNDTSQICRKHFREAYDAALNGELWALKMFDASAKPDAGMLIGNFRSLGDYDECLSVSHPENKFIGQYCFFAFKPTGFQEFVKRNSLGKEMHPQFINGAGIGMCLPSTCSGDSVAQKLNSQSFHNISVNQYVNIILSFPDMCKTREFQQPWTKLDYSFIAVASVIFLLTVAGTVSDCRQRFFQKTEESALKKSPLVFFSVYTNTIDLFSRRQQQQFVSMSGLKGLSLLGIVLGHTSLLTMGIRYLNLEDVWKDITGPRTVLLNNTQNVTDTFFTLGAMLLVISFFKEIRNKGGYDFPLALIKRYLRLTPVYALLMLFMMSIILHVVIGPLSVPLEYTSRDLCLASWPYNLLYIQNYVKKETLMKCLTYTWYLDADMQLFVLSPLLLYTGYYFPRLGTLFALLCGLGVASFETYEAYVCDWGPLAPFSPDPNHVKYDHFLTHYRSAPWFMGIFMGFIFVKVLSMGNKFKLSKTTNRICWLVFGTIFFICQIVLFFFDNNYTQPAAAFCLGFRRIGWSLFIGWTVIACSTGHGDFANNFLAWGPFDFISKISYTAYLVHSPIINGLGAAQREILFGDIRETISQYIAICILTVLISTALTILVELPCAKLLTFSFQKVQIYPFPRSQETISRMPTQIITEKEK